MARRRSSGPPRGARRAWLRLRHLLEARGDAAHDDTRDGAHPRVLRGEAIRRRLELYARAILDQPVQVEVAAPERRRGRFESVNRFVTARWNFKVPPQVRSDAQRVVLPSELPVYDGETAAAALARYRFQVASHALRIARGTATSLASMDALEGRLYVIRESALAESELVRRLPRLAPIAVAERQRALAARPTLASLSPIDREVETLLRAVLASDPAHPEALIGEDDGASGSAAWASERAAVMKAKAGGITKLRDFELAPGWGLIESPDDPARATLDLASDDDGGAADDSEAGAGAGSDVPPPSPDGQTPDEVAGDRAAPAASAPLDPLDTASRVVDEPALPSGGTRYNYAEWDRGEARLVPRRVTVTETEAEGGDAQWAERELAEHGALVRGIRARFDRLRARRVTMRAQRDGDALDLAACVQNMVEWRSGRAGDDRLYLAVSPARRAIAITLLVDTSGSTMAPVLGAEVPDQRVIDLEKSSVLLASEALDALGDPFAVMGFSSRGARAVHLRLIKGFGEGYGATARARMAGLEPGGNTRLGAAVRHAAALMRAQPVSHRLLLILSDGQPNDSDGYVDRYAHDDSRHAVLEARAAGVVTHCLTIDREEPEALPHIFGPAGYTMLTSATQLPTALLGAVRALLAR